MVQKKWPLAILLSSLALCVI